MFVFIKVKKMCIYYIYKSSKHSRSSFTLIEMLIVVVIIGILATALIPRLQGAQERSRDLTRKADMNTLRNSLEVYMTDNTLYPLPYSSASYNTNAMVCTNETQSQAWINALT